MSANRIRTYRQPQPTLDSVPPIAPQGFVACPVYGALAVPEQQWAWYQEVYRAAYRLAVENCVPLCYRRLFSNWN